MSTVAGVDASRVDPDGAAVRMLPNFLQQRVEILPYRLTVDWPPEHPMI